MLKLMRRGQSTAEYAIVIGLVIAAAVAMQVYVKRGLQGKIKVATDYTDSDAASVVGNAGQYEPYYQSSDMTGTHTTSLTENTATGGAVTRTTGNDTSTRTGTSTVGAVQNP
ncbi:MAG: hypothetical protein ABSE81_07060 [Candidatus Omnitrophota bacterium]|jgi:hypothetical protein